MADSSSSRSSASRALHFLKNISRWRSLRTHHNNCSQTTNDITQIETIWHWLKGGNREKFNIHMWITKYVKNFKCNLNNIKFVLNITKYQWIRVLIYNIYNITSRSVYIYGLYKPIKYSVYWTRHERKARSILWKTLKRFQ